MLSDSCFILELFIRCFIKSDESKDDPILCSRKTVASLQRDLILLENQIPFFILMELWQIARDLLPPQMINRKSRVDLSTTTVIELAFNFLAPFLAICEGKRDTSEDVDHLLHLMHIYLTFTTADTETDSCLTVDTETIIPCATELAEAGVKFKSDAVNKLFELSFKSRTLKIPTVVVNDLTATLFSNLIVFEQCIYNIKRCIISYIWMMRTLLKDYEDAVLLQQEGILKNNTSGNINEVACLFNEMCKGVVMKTLVYEGLCKEVNQYLKNPYYRYMSCFRREFSRHHWSILSTILLVILGLQTIYVIGSYQTH